MFYDHLYENKHLRHLITRLIELRQRTGINCRSEVGGRLGWLGGVGGGVEGAAAGEAEMSGRGCEWQPASYSRLPCSISTPFCRCPAPLCLPPQVEILCAERDVYAAEIDERVAMQIGPGDFAPDPAYEIGGWGACCALFRPPPACAGQGCGLCAGDGASALRVCQLSHPLPPAPPGLSCAAVDCGHCWTIWERKN